jgi:hypothetical protein
MVPMPLVTPLSKSSRLNNPDHPRFVGLALLRSLLLHEEVAADSRRTDTVLDLIALLLRDAPAASVVKSFCSVRRECEPVCYLAIFRLRRWLEEQIVVHCATGPWQPLSLAFQEYRRIEQDYRRQAWESALDSRDWNTVPVVFAWTCVGHVESGLVAQTV